MRQAFRIDIGLAVAAADLDAAVAIQTDVIAFAESRGAMLEMGTIEPIASEEIIADSPLAEAMRT